MSGEHWFHIGLLSLLNLLVIGGIQLSRKWIHSVELTRKMAHVGSGLLALLIPRWFPVSSDVWPLLFLWVIFSIFLYWSHRKKWLKSINDVNRKTVGAYIIPTALIVLWLGLKFFSKNQQQPQFAMFDIPLLILTIGDPGAAYFGSKYGKRRVYIGSNKTRVGFLAMAIISFCIAFIYGLVLDFSSFGGILPNSTVVLLLLVSSVFIALISAIVEAFSKKGWDNFNVPVVVFIILYWFVH